MNRFFLNALWVVMLTGNLIFLCHASATEKYDVKKFGPVKPIIMEEPVNVSFDHQVHTKQIGLACNSCHDELFVMQRGVTPKKSQTMDSLSKGESCGACHDGKTGFASNTRCNSCHIRSKNMTPSDPHPHGDVQDTH